jgi:hypothetical protein
MSSAQALDTAGRAESRSDSLQRGNKLTGRVSGRESYGRFRGSSLQRRKSNISFVGPSLRPLVLSALMLSVENKLRAYQSSSEVLTATSGKLVPSFAGRGC